MSAGYPNSNTYLGVEYPQNPDGPGFLPQTLAMTFLMLTRIDIDSEGAPKMDGLAGSFL